MSHIISGSFIGEGDRYCINIGSNGAILTPGGCCETFPDDVVVGGHVVAQCVVGRAG